MVKALSSMAGAAFALALSGCYGDVEGPPYRAQIVDLTEIDPDSGEPQFELVTREFSYLEDFRELSGPELRVFRGGTLVARDFAGSVAFDGRIANAGEAGLRYIVEDGVAIPRDYPTLAMLSAYFQYERVLADLDRVTGMDVEELVDAMGRLEVFFEPAFELRSDAADARAVPKFNAFFVPGLQQFGLAQRSELEDVPLSVNLQVIAHEFGHALFELSFFENDYEDCDPDRAGENANDPLFPGRFSVEYAMAGINEGFSDFLSFAYTGGTNPVAALPLASAGERDFAETEFAFDDLMETDVDSDPEPPCRGSFYCVGTLFARSLYETMLEEGYDPLDPEGRGAFSRSVVGAMARAKGAIRELPSDVLPAPSPAVARCEPPSGAAAPYDGEVAGAFLGAFVSEMPAESRVPLCEALIEHFGESGFPGPARGTCEPS